MGSYRKAAKIPYPYEYASYEQVQTASPANSKLMLAFNAAQRGHQNFNENHPTAIAAMLISGLKYPVATAVLGALWSVNRVIYGIGYTSTASTDSKGRYKGALWMVAHYAMILMAGKAAYDFTMA